MAGCPLINWNWQRSLEVLQYGGSVDTWNEGNASCFAFESLNGSDDPRWYCMQVVITVLSSFLTQLLALSAAVLIIPLLRIMQSNFWVNLCFHKGGSGWKQTECRGLVLQNWWLFYLLKLACSKNWGCLRVLSFGSYKLSWDYIIFSIAAIQIEAGLS